MISIKAVLTLLVATALGAVASPVDHVIHRRFTCANRLQGYCHASNVNSYCQNGEFRSRAYETCSGYCSEDSLLNQAAYHYSADSVELQQHSGSGVQYSYEEEDITTF
ncbi:hypothetical protein NLG97_g9161 [Lecanicillium saksenae]|uniref:Uncharacterized protein n=1 Tax=Lecanicillium saksenae TaxID=468837 RepID=A0ACC1QHC2_9HYPO|nr:hypothetical protein NLG97_g9161 [Lecanicillium saksenae]